MFFGYQTGEFFGVDETVMLNVASSKWSRDEFHNG